MTHKQLFNNIMRYGDYNRMPVWHWDGWPETRREWAEQGLPEEADHAKALNAEPMTRGVRVHTGLLPEFVEKVIEETDRYKLIRQSDGVIAEHSKVGSSIPKYVDFILKDRAGWEQYRERLQPSPERYPEDLDAHLDELRAHDGPTSIWIGSMVGWIRDWMGVENLSYVIHDDPDLMREMVETLSDLVCATIEPILRKFAPDIGWGWEDICFRSGPLVSPKAFREFAVPGYRKITGLLKSYGVNLALIDCDGKIDDLVPLWLEGGINVMFPVEIGAWNADPMAFRTRYGKELRIIGGINKLELTKGRAAIDAEIERRLPLMREGGYIPLPDHIIIPGTPLDDYRYYLDRIRKLRF
jgi:uroporphyrinogen decarboxylase